MEVIDIRVLSVYSISFYAKELCIRNGDPVRKLYRKEDQNNEKLKNHLKNVYIANEGCDLHE